MYMCMYMHMCMYTHVYVHASVYVDVAAYLYVYVYVHVHILTCMQRDIHTYIFAQAKRMLERKQNAIMHNDTHAASAMTHTKTHTHVSVKKVYIMYMWSTYVHIFMKNA